MPSSVYVSSLFDPYENLAFEEQLCQQQTDGITLFIWQNAHTVVIGRNQNAWKECRTAELLQDGGRLARRTTGGGAVYHDLGNLNFSVITKTSSPEKSRGYDIVRRAVESFGIKTELSGRNDLTIAKTGQKFSGNAFRYENGVFLHHGTLLISCDAEKMQRYLNPSFEKMESKGVSSVKARVANLSQFHENISVETMKNALVCSFFELNGKVSVRESVKKLESEEIAKTLATDEWIYGRSPQANVTLGKRFNWGEIEILFDVKDGRIQNAKVYSDMLDIFLPEKLQLILRQKEFKLEILAKEAEKLDGAQAKDIAEWLRKEAL